MARANSEGIGIYYEACGQGSPILLVNGLGISGLGWEIEFVSALAQDHKVVAFDNRGTGRSDKPDVEYSIQGMARDCVAVLDDAGITKAHVVGASMGGLIALELALSHHERVASLILCCTNCGWGGQTPLAYRVVVRLFLRSLLHGALSNKLSREALGLFFTGNFIEKEWELLNQLWKRSSKYPTPIYAYRRQLNALLRYSVCDRLSQIPVPVLVLGGDGDRHNPVNRLKELADKIPKAQLHIYHGLGHGFIIEVRDDVARRIQNFITQSQVCTTCLLDS